MRNTHNNFIDNATQSIFSGIESVIGSSIHVKHITLEGFHDPRLRTQFFEELIDNIEGHNLDSVTDAYCYRPQRRSDGSEEDGSDDLERQPYVVRVTLKGNDVNKTFVANDLYSRGYYLVKVVWRIKAERHDNELIELEAQFGDPPVCSAFSYQARCVIACVDGVATDQKRGITLREQDKYFRLIEAAARNALMNLET